LPAIPGGNSLTNHFCRSVAKRKDDINDGVHLDGLPIYQKRLVDPFANGVQGGLLEVRRATDNVQVAI